jgi:hypothetical protein
MYCVHFTKYVQVRITNLYNDGQVTERKEFLNIYETVSGQKCHKAHVEVCSRRAVQRKRMHARRVHYNILAGIYAALFPERTPG